MATHQSSARSPRTEAFRESVARIDVLGPLVAVGALFAVVIRHRFAIYHGNVTGFVLFGHHWVRFIHPPRHAVILSPFGYDGQFFYLQAKDPLVAHSSTIAGFRGANEAFRLQRMAYPALAYVFAAGQLAAIPWAMLLLNIAVVLAITGGFALYARGRGWSAWWALAVGFLAGFLTGTVRDLSDPVAVSAMLAGLLLWHRGQRWWAAGLLTVAVLAREPMVLAVIATAVEEAIATWRRRGERGAGRDAVARVWPVILVPAAAFIAWQIYIDARYGGDVASTSLAFLPPFEGLRDEVRHALDDPSLRNTVWDLAYLGLMSIGILAALGLAWRKRSTAAIAAALFGLSLLVLVFGDPWSYTRLSAPMFAALVLSGLEHRSWPALAICASAAAMTVVAPLAPWMGAV